MRVLKVRRVPLPYALFHSYNTHYYLIFFIFLSNFQTQSGSGKERPTFTEQPVDDTTQRNANAYIHTYVCIFLTRSLSQQQYMYFSIRFFLFVSFFDKNRFSSYGTKLSRFLQSNLAHNDFFV